MPRRTTAEKNRLKRKADAKLRKYSKILSTKGMVTKDQIEVGKAYAKHKQALFEKVKKIEDKAARRRFEKKGLDYDAHLANTKRENDEAVKRRKAEPKPERILPGMLTDAMVKKGYVKRVCKCGNWAIGKNLVEIAFCGGCGRMSDKLRENHVAVYENGGYSIARKGRA